MKISEILWTIANEYICENNNEFSKKFGFICDAIFDFFDFEDSESKNKVFEFIKSLGMGRGLKEFREFYNYDNYGWVSTIKSQAARYNFLMFASMYAEELEKSGELSDV